MSAIDPGAMLELFDGRRDAYGADDGLCIKRKLTEKVILDHLEGRRRIGVYPLAGENRDRVKWGCVDIDVDAFSLALALARRLGALGIGAQVEKSKGKGWHVWVFFAEWVEAWKVRAVLHHVVGEFRDDPAMPKVGLEVFPKQDSVPIEKYGNYINLPCFGADKDGKTRFHDASDDGSPEPYAWSPERTFAHDAYALDYLVNQGLKPVGTARAGGLSPKAASATPNTGKGPRVASTGKSPYGAAALRSECARVASTPEGERNETLFKASASIGELVGAGAIERTEATAALVDAGRASGLPDDESESTVANGIKRGEQQPRELNRSPAHGSARSTTAGAAAADESWPTPAPLIADVGALPPFPVDALPTWLREWVEAEAEQTQTPLDMAGCFALAAVAASTGKKYRVVVRFGWSEPLGLFVVVMMAPAERKSAVHADATAPIHDFETIAGEVVAPLRREAIAKVENLDARIKILRGKAARAKEFQRAEFEQEITKLVEEAADIWVRPMPRFVADDVTPEALARLIVEQGGRMAVMSAEGTLFDIVAGRYSENGGPNLDVLLKGHAGDPLVVDRVGRTNGRCRSPVLTLCLAVQPAVLQGLARRPMFRGRGLIARHLFSLPASRVGLRNIKPAPMPESVHESYWRGLLALLRMPEKRDVTGELFAAELPFSKDARERIEQYAAALEPRLVSDLQSIADWAGKLCGAIARIAGNLALARRAGSVGSVGDVGGGPVVDLEDVAAAIQFGDYFLAHARAAFGAMAVDPVVEGAIAVVRWIDTSGSPTFTRRRVLQNFSKGRFFGPKGKELLDAVLALLDHHGFIRPLDAEPPNPKGGHPAGPTFEAHPVIGADGWNCVYGQRDEAPEPDLHDLQNLRNGAAT